MISTPAKFARLALITLLLACLPLVHAAAPQIVPFRPPPIPATRFLAMDITIDAGATPLAAYQIELNTGPAQLVGIEGGDPAPFHDAPYYDPRALQNNRIILAAFSLDQPAQLPHGRTRIARLHLEISGDAAPEITTNKILATDDQGHSIPATLHITRYEGAPQ